jgi:hypothetical protein
VSVNCKQSGCCSATTLDNDRLRGGYLESLEGLTLYRARLVDRQRRCSIWPFSPNRGKPLPQAGFDGFPVDGEVLVGPVGGLVCGFRIAELGDQSVAQRL